MVPEGFFLHHTTTECKYVSTLKESKLVHGGAYKGKVELFVIRESGSEPFLHPLLKFVSAFSCSYLLVPFAPAHTFWACLHPLSPFEPACASHACSCLMPHAHILINLHIFHQYRWQIQGFPEVGAPTPKLVLLCNFFCWKWKTLESQGSLGSANGSISDDFWCVFGEVSCA